ncbi:MAG: hypothetical protein JSS00_15735 [Proteobacteria bacterium]|nr:hypothetical protein [Pseudomonadota bacterium]
MASDSLPDDREIAEQARRLALALDVIEARLDGLGIGAAPDAIADALADPVRAFDAAVREASRR